MVGADVLLVTSSAVLEPDLVRRLYQLVAQQRKVELVIIFPAAEMILNPPRGLFELLSASPTAQMISLITQNHSRSTSPRTFVDSDTFALARAHFLQSVSCQVKLPPG